MSTRNSNVTPLLRNMGRGISQTRTNISGNKKLANDAEKKGDNLKFNNKNSLSYLNMFTSNSYSNLNDEDKQVIIEKNDKGNDKDSNPYIPPQAREGWNQYRGTYEWKKNEKSKNGVEGGNGRAPSTLYAPPQIRGCGRNSSVRAAAYAADDIFLDDGRRNNKEKKDLTVRRHLHNNSLTILGKKLQKNLGDAGGPSKIGEAKDMGDLFNVKTKNIGYNINFGTFVNSVGLQDGSKKSGIKKEQSKINKDIFSNKMGNKTRIKSPTVGFQDGSKKSGIKKEPSKINKSIFSNKMGNEARIKSPNQYEKNGKLIRYSRHKILPAQEETRVVINNEKIGNAERRATNCSFHLAFNHIHRGQLKTSSEAMSNLGRGGEDKEKGGFINSCNQSRTHPINTDVFDGKKAVKTMKITYKK